MLHNAEEHCGKPQTDLAQLCDRLAALLTYLNVHQVLQLSICM